MSPSSAIVVIDLQAGVVAGCRDRDGVLGRTQRLVERGRAAGVSVVYVRHEGPGLERDSAAWEFAAPLRPASRS